MRKILCTALMAIGSFVNAQNDLPKMATEIAPLLVGEKIPSLSLKSVDNTDVNLAELLGKKRTVLVFYRGGWCPYCNIQLAALGEAEKELLDLGYQIIAVSPDSPQSLKVTGVKDKLNYTLLSDSKGELSKAVGIAFQAPDNFKPIITEGSQGVNTTFLPVPTVFIVNLNGEIQFEHITPDFKHRITNDLLVAVAKSLK
jgi:peroxiredoxin